MKIRLAQEHQLSKGVVCRYNPLYFHRLEAIQRVRRPDPNAPQAGIGDAESFSDRNSISLHSATWLHYPHYQPKMGPI